MTGINDTENAQETNTQKTDVVKDIPEKQLQQSSSEETNMVNGHSNGSETSVVNGDQRATMATEDGEGKDKTGVPADGEQDGEVVVIQETGFNIRIITPGLDPFDLPVSSMELVQEIYQVLIDREESCHRTCFSLQLDGVTLDNFSELKSIEGLQEGSVIKVVEEPYTAREARIHVRHIRDLLKSTDNQDAYAGIECNSLSFLNNVCGGNILDKKVNKSESVDCTPPEYIMPGNKDRPVMPLHPLCKENRGPQCVKVLTYSGWNPPPGPRKMHGDLLYLYLVTLEDKRYHLTASTRGFYVNQSSHDEFNPKPASQKHLSHSLVELLNQISPSFKRNFAVLLKQRSMKHPFERVATPYQIFSWLAPNMEHSVDAIRAEDAFSSRLGYEEHIPGQTRDWNEELQTTRELPRKHLPERLIRERAIFKVHSDFVVAATRGAVAVIDGNIMAINPGEDAKMQMFLWNNIFFSLGFDVKDHYKEFGGDAAAYVAPSNDLQGVKAYSSVDCEGLYTLGTVVVDYRGYRVTAQSIIPGILEREQEQSVVYGSIDFGKTVVTHDKYKELLQKTSQALKIRPHKVINEKDEEIELLSSVECKGIVGNDGRHYVLDLLRTFPPDVNFMQLEGEVLSDAVKAFGFPRKHSHTLVCLRQELIDTFVENRYVAFVKHAAFQFQQLRYQKLKEEQERQEKEKSDQEKAAAKKEEEKTEGEKKPEKKVDEIETEEAKKIVSELTTDANSNKDEDASKEIVRKAAEAVKSLSDTEFTVAFNPDVFQPQVKHANPEGEMLVREKQLVKDAAEFLVVHQIPSFIRDCLEHTSSPIDGYTLSEALHHNGINIRYLGTVTETVAKYPQLSYLHSICICELVTRAAKHLFKLTMQGVEMMSLSAAISHFLNCLLGSFQTPNTHINADELQSQRSKKRKKKKVPTATLR